MGLPGFRSLLILFPRSGTVIKGASPNHFAKDNVIVTLGGEGVRAVTLTLVKTYVPSPCYWASLYAARKPFCTIIAAVGMSISLLGTLGCDVMKGGGGGGGQNLTSQ